MICFINGYIYIIIIIVDYSRYGYLYLIKKKNKFKSFERFKEFGNEVKKQTRKISKYFDWMEVVNTLAKYFNKLTPAPTRLCECWYYKLRLRNEVEKQTRKVL